jgi:hypothetical protein
MSNINYIQVPPDSTGKKVRQLTRHDVLLTSPTASVLSALSVNDVITGATSGITGIFTGTYTNSTETVVFLEELSATAFSASEDLLSPSSTKIGTYSSATTIETPSYNLSDPNNASFKQRVSKRGEAIMSFEQGNMTFDAFGHAQYTTLTKIADYNHIYYDDALGLLYNSTGSITHTPADSLLTFSVNSTSGSKTQRTTNQYYPYNPSEGNLFTFVVASGDSGKTGCVRKWGCYDDDEGFWFELSGSTISVGMNSTTLSDVTINQSSWNGEQLNDANTSDYILDITKLNIFWIDFQWLGAGRARFGTYSADGRKIILHTLLHANTALKPYMRRATLPMRWEIYNTENTSGTSEFKLSCSSVFRENNGNDVVQYSGKIQTVMTPRLAVSGSFLPILSAKPSTLFNGQTNRITVIPTDIESCVEGDACIINVILNGQLTGSTFTHPTGSESPTLLDTDATEINAGLRRESIMLPAGVFSRELDQNLVNALSLGANGTSQPTISFAVKTCNPSGSANVTLIVRYKEAQ